jgi:DNA polymerase IV
MRTTPYILHLDMDAFYASVEKAEDPSLAGKPVIVGAPPDARGVVSAASYEARKYGVHSAMPSRTAGKLCPHGVFLPPDFEKYKAYSERVMRILWAASPLVEPLSLDEAFVDLTGCERLWGWIPDKARALQEEVRAELGITCSIGLASTRVVAKIASDYMKPNGATIVAGGNEAWFLAPLAIERMPGIGKVTAQRLHLLGYKTLGDIQAASAETLRRHFGDHGLVLADRARGIGSHVVTIDADQKSLSKEHTFDEDTEELDLLLGTLHYLCERVASRLRAKGLAGRTVQLKLRDSDFTTLTRRLTLPDSTNSDEDLWRAAVDLFEKAWVPGTAVRLIGIGMSSLDDAGGQMSLGEDQEPAARGSVPGIGKRRSPALDQALDRIRDKWGVDSVTRGSTQELRRRWAKRAKQDYREE